jgi:hypothetical protein
MVWDDVCVVNVVIYDCGPCPGVGGDGDCCSPNDTPGCDDDAVEACVCEADYTCCLAAWDQLCADQVTSLQCGTC